MIDPQDEKRTTPRQRTLKGGRVVFNGGRSTIDCTIRNLSPRGARLVVTSVVGIPDSFLLLLDETQKRPARIVWRTAKELGIAFETMH